MQKASELLKKLHELKPVNADETHPYVIMEVCGTHTMAIAECGLRQLLPSWVKLISGPGCPVCVTPAGAIDEVLRISMLDNVILCSYGDFLRIPGSVKGDSLKARKALGADVRVVYSAMDAVEIAEKEQDKQVVFLGVGFETTAPGTACAILDAKEKGLSNFSVLSLMKYTLPAVEFILNDPRCQLDGLICPGHVATIIGAKAFEFLPLQYQVPAVVAGFERDEVVTGVYDLCKMLCEQGPELINDYPSCVKDSGNLVAQKFLNDVFEAADDVWRGLGVIENSGMKIRDEYKEFDAGIRFGYHPENKEGNNGCCCGAVLLGIMTPEQCPQFGTNCTSSDPIGPCMVSGEGACNAAFKYRDLLV